MGETIRNREDRKLIGEFSSRKVFEKAKGENFLPREKESKDEFQGHLRSRRNLNKAFNEKDPQKRDKSISEIIEKYSHVVVADFDQTFVPKDAAFRLIWDSIPDRESRLAHLVEFARKSLIGIKELKGRKWHLGASGDVKVLMKAAFEGQAGSEVFETLNQVGRNLTLNPKILDFIDAYKKYTAAEEVSMFILTRNTSYLVYRTVGQYAGQLKERGISIEGIIGNLLEFDNKGIFKGLKKVRVTTESKRNMIPPGEIYLVDKQESEELKDLNVFNVQSEDQNYPEIMRVMVEKRKRMKIDHLLVEEEAVLKKTEEDLQETEEELEHLFSHPSVVLSERAAKERGKLFEEFLLKRSGLALRKDSIKSQRRELRYALEQLDLSLKGAYHELHEDTIHKILSYIRRKFK